MIQSNRRLVAALYCAVLALVFLPIVAFATGLEEESASDEPLLLLYPRTVSSIPILAAIEEHPDLYVGEFYTDHAQALARLLAGEADAIASGFSLGYARYQSARDVVHVGTTVWGVSAIMTAEAIESIDELAGETIYAPFERSPIDIFLKLLLEQRGLSDSVTIAYAPFPQSSALLAQGETAASVLVEPIASRLEVTGSAFRLQNLHDGWAEVTGGERRSPQVSMFTTSARIDAVRDRYVALRDDLGSTTREMIEAPAEFASRYAEVLGFPVPVLVSAIENSLFDTPDTAATREIIELYADTIGQARPGAEFYLE